MTEVECKTELELPPIHVTMDEMHRLSALANSSLALFPRAAHFLAREMDRARVVSDDTELRSVVRMGCQVSYRDEVELVYPHEADISQRRISILTPVGAALIGLSVGQAIEFPTPGHETRSLTVLGVSP